MNAEAFSLRLLLQRSYEQPSLATSKNPVKAQSLNEVSDGPINTR